MLVRRLVHVRREGRGAYGEQHDEQRDAPSFLLERDVTIDVRSGVLLQRILQ